MPNKKNKKANSKSKKPSNLPTLPSSNFNISIAMESDWRIGSGGGIPGNIDSLVQRDSEGIPGFISAKTLTGVWRDACETVALGLDGGTEGIWSQYVVYLFGDQPALNEDSAIANPPIGAALNVRPAQLHPDIRDAILDRSRSDADVAKQALIKAMTMSKPGISIDPRTGCAVEKFLRQEEMVRMGTYLTSQCQLNLEELEEEQQRAAWALLIAGAKYLDRLGGKRRRGAGRSRLELAGVEDIDIWLNWIGNNLKPEELSENRVEKSDRPNQELAENSLNRKHSWLQVPLTITTKLPVIIKARTIGNIVETLDYIPGNRLLPIVAKKLGSLGINIVEAISSQQLIITNATVKLDNQEGRPVPLALFYEKMSGGFDKGQVYNQLIETPSEDKQLKGYRQGYVGQIASQNGMTLPDYTTVSTVIQTHNTIDDASQRPAEEIGGVYSYQAIEAGTVLQAQVRLTQNLIDTLSKNTQWWQKLAGRENIGTSKKDDYGLVEIEPSKPTRIEAKNNVIAASDSKKHQLIVWLLSDVLIRDRQLRPSISLNDFKRTLERAINYDITAEDRVSLTLEQKDNTQADSFPAAYIRQRRTESWQRRWCLPRPSLAGLMAGSCIKFSLETKLDTAELNRRLEQIAIVGVGERTIEGYGQIAFNDDLLKQNISNLTAKSKSDNSTNQPKGKVDKIIADRDSFVYARLIETQAWRSAINNAAKALASTAENRERLLGIKVTGLESESCPSMSQLGNLRTFIARLREPKDIKAIANWLDSTEEKRAKKWEKTSNGLEKIKALITSDRLIWEELAQYTYISLEDLTLTKDAEKFLSQQQWKQVKQTSIADYLTNKSNLNSLRLILWAEAVRTVVYECIRAHKRNFERG